MASTDFKKNAIFYLILTGVAAITLKQGWSITEYSNLLKAESPECMASNPNFYQIVFGTIGILVFL